MSPSRSARASAARVLGFPGLFERWSQLGQGLRCALAVFMRLGSSGCMLRLWRVVGVGGALFLLSCGSEGGSSGGATGGGLNGTGATGSGGLGGGGQSGGTGGSPASGGAGEASQGGASGGGESGGVGGTAPLGGVGASGVGELWSEFDAIWDFESVEGAIVRSAIGEATLTLTNATVSPGPTGNQLALVGDGSSAASLGSVLDTSRDFSISVWVKLDELADYTTFVSVDGSQVSAVYLQKRSDHRFSMTTFSADSVDASPCVTTAEIQPRQGEWYHVVGTRSATTRAQRVYVDGVLSSKSTCPEGVFAATGSLNVGRGMWGGSHGDHLVGALDEVGVISRVLSPQEVLELYRAGRPEANHYLFAYFVEVGQGRGDGLRLAHSHDGLHWGAIGGGKVFMPPSVGGGSFRDPHVMRDPDGQYHLVWTTTCVTWAESNCVQDRGLGHASSPDLVTWSAADYITIDLNVEHVWAPETFYDAASSQFMIFFSSPIDQDPSASDPHSIYYVLTSNFESYTDPAVLYSQTGRNFIDGTIRAQDGGYLMILKDEANGQKNLRAIQSSSLFGAGAWSGAPSEPLTGSYAAEGPSLLERDGQLFIYFDKYGEGTYGALRATSTSNLVLPSSWEDISSTVFFPGVRHGTPIEVPWDVFEAVALEAGRD